MLRCARSDKITRGTYVTSTVPGMAIRTIRGKCTGRYTSVMRARRACRLCGQHQIQKWQRSWHHGTRNTKLAMDNWRHPSSASSVISVFKVYCCGPPLIASHPSVYCCNSSQCKFQYDRKAKRSFLVPLDGLRYAGGSER